MKELLKQAGIRNRRCTSVAATDCEETISYSGIANRSCRPTISVLLDVKMTFDSVDRVVFWRYLSLKGLGNKFIPLIQFLYTYSRSRVCDYGDLLPQFTTEDGVWNGCSLSSFIPSFLIEMAMEIVLFPHESSGFIA